MEPKKIIGPPFKFYDGNLYIIRKAFCDGIQEFLDPAGDAKKRYDKCSVEQIERKKAAEKSFKNRLKEDSTEQKHYNSVMNSIVEYDNIREYKYRRYASFKKKLSRLFKFLT